MVGKAYRIDSDSVLEELGRFEGRPGTATKLKDGPDIAVTSRKETE
jgi:hypothetical protein